MPVMMAPLNATGRGQTAAVAKRSKVRGWLLGLTCGVKERAKEELNEVLHSRIP